KEKILTEYAVNAMLDRNNAVVFAIDRFRNEKELVNLLSRKISEADKLRILEEQSQNPDGLNRLKYYNRLSNTALTEDMHPYEGILNHVPVYAIYKVVHKKIQGRDVTVIEIVGAVIDGVFICGEIVIPGSGIVANQVVKQATLAIARKSSIQVAKQIGKEMGKREIALGSKTITKKGTEKALTNVAEQTLKKSPHSFLSFDTTPSIRYAFDKARMFGIKNETFKKMTALDARIFMRSDRKVVLNFKALAMGFDDKFIGIPKVIAKGTVESVGVNTIGDTILNSETAQEMLLKFTNKKGITEQRNLSYEEYQSAMWLSAATGKLEQAAKKVTDQTIEENIKHSKP
ncbi:MAG: hypothetical protein LBP87_11035, partial [Planctomycetaceae bacterium]|nr:hypothetical protein [Planctomycetaceae bacterium]